MNSFAKVKICGIRESEHLKTAEEAGATWVGFVLVDTSPRFVDVDQVKRLLSSLITAIPVALMSDPTDDQIDELMKLDIQTIQLHGNESPMRVSDIKQRTNAEIWKSIAVENVLDLNQTFLFDQADKFVLDAKPPTNADRQGGHGQIFDWQILKSFHMDTPWVLAGGLNPSNVVDAINQTNAEIVDVSSGVESSLGVKDGQLILDFLKAVKNDST